MATKMSAAAVSIRSAALELFSAYGFAAVSVADIAQKAGVCKATVFHHFSSKDDLYLAVVKTASIEHAEYVDQLLTEKSTAAVKLHKLVLFQTTNMKNNQYSPRLLMRQLSDNSHSRIENRARALFEKNLKAICELFEQGCRGGEFHIDDRSLLEAALGLLATCQSVLVNRQTIQQMSGHHLLVDPQVLARTVADLLLTGILSGAPKRSIDL